VSTLTSPSTRGFILPVVLLVLATLSAMAALLISETRTELAIARNIRAAAEVEALADAGIFHMLSELEKREYPQTLKPPESWSFGKGSLKITVEPESGKIDLNTGHKDLLAGVLEISGMPSSQARRQAARMESYRDAKSGRYFNSIDEFATTFSLDADLAKALRPLTTVYTALEGFAPGGASEEVFAAIPGFRESGVASMLANRDGSIELTPENLATLQRYTVEGIPVYTIIAEARLGKTDTFRRLAVVNLSKDGEPVFYEWRQLTE